MQEENDASAEDNAANEENKETDLEKFMYDLDEAMEPIQESFSKGAHVNDYVLSEDDKYDTKLMIDKSYDVNGTENVLLEFVDIYPSTKDFKKNTTPIILHDSFVTYKPLDAKNKKAQLAEHKGRIEAMLAEAGRKNMLEEILIDEDGDLKVAIGVSQNLTQKDVANTTWLVNKMNTVTKDVYGVALKVLETILMG
jgi:hypothetical protein